MSVQSTAMPRCTRSLSASSFQRLTIRQNSCAVRSASYTAECASWLSKSSPAAVAALLSTVWPRASPPSDTVSKQLKGWNGLRLWLQRRTAALMNDRSKAALCPTRMARWQFAARTALRTAAKTRFSASRSGRAPRNGLSGSMPVISSERGSIRAPSNASTCVDTTASGCTRPSSSMRMGNAAISSSALRSGSKPPVSTSTTTGRNPRKRSTMRVDWTVSIMGVRIQDGRRRGAYDVLLRVSRGRLEFVPAQIGNDAIRTMRLACRAHVAAVQDQPVVGVAAECVGNRLDQLVLHRAHGLAGRQAGAVGDAEDVRVHGNGRFAEGGVEDHVGGLAADAGQRLQFLARARNLAAVVFDQDAAGGDDVFGLVVVQADGVDVALESVFAQVEDGPGGAGHREQLARGLVDADVGCLRGQGHGDQQLERRGVFQLGGRARIELAQAREHVDDVGFFHRAFLSVCARRAWRGRVRWRPVRRCGSTER